MIGYISGKIIDKSEGFLILETGGVGYKVFVTGTTLEKVSVSGATALWTHLAVRENSQDLFGFERKDELEFFELLISISGIGPRTALSILNVANIETLKQAVATENSAHLTKVAGIGRKTAEKIVLELRDKLGGIYSPEGNLTEEGDALEALTSLGYNPREARDALREVPSDTMGTSEKVKRALKILSGNK
jgi:Holliday junction DNA helicase RuvA